MPLGEPDQVPLTAERTYRLTGIFRANRIVIVAFPLRLDITLFPPWSAPFPAPSSSWRLERRGADALLCRILGGGEEVQEQMPFQAFNGREQMPVREILTGADKTPMRAFMSMGNFSPLEMPSGSLSFLRCISKGRNRWLQGRGIGGAKIDMGYV